MESKRTDRHTPEQRRRNMQAIRGKDSAIELKLRSALWKDGIRYRKHVRSLPGHPDIVIGKFRICLFVDSEFWHGFDWEHRKTDFKSKREFWISKIEANMKRDSQVNIELSDMGWTVMRFWGDDIKRNPQLIVDQVKSLISERRSQP